MKSTPRYTAISLLVPILALGLAFLLASARPAVAEPVAVTPLPPVADTDGRAGACFSYYPDPQTGVGRPFVPLVLDAGARWDRFPFDWRVIESGNDSWTFGPHDELVDDLHAAGMRGLVGILMWTPDWASTCRLGGPAPSWPRLDARPPGWYAPVPRGALASVMDVSAASSPPQGLYLAWDDPGNHWGDYVHTVVSRYGDRIKYWEMWNEPEWSYFWTGTSADYAQLLKVGYQATKDACPDCTVLFGGLHYWANPSYYRWVLSAIDADPTASQNNYFFDVMSVHLYSRSSSIYDEVERIRDGMSVYGVGDHPIWLTETGAPVWGDPQAYNPKYDFAATQDEAAAYVIQSYANAWAAGVERYLFFRVNDQDMSEYFGLVRNDYSLRPTYVAYQVAATYLVSPTFTTRVISDSSSNVTLWGTPRGKVSALWNGSPASTLYTLPAAMPVTTPTATLVDRWGITRVVTATGGTYTFTLPGATANLVSDPDDYFIGGDPLIVIESETPNQPPTSTVLPLPPVIYSPTFTVTWEGRDGQSGILFYDVQLRDGDGGEWVPFQESTALTASQVTGHHGHTYGFRSRATDRVGNREAWPEEPQAHTTLDLSSTLSLSVGAFFADENQNGVWDRPITETEEVTLIQVALRFRDQAGRDVVSPTVGSAWAFTTTVYAGQSYQLQAVSADYTRVISMAWPRGGEVYTRTYNSLGLWPRTWSYLPLILRQGGG